MFNEWRTLRNSELLKQDDIHGFHATAHLRQTAGSRGEVSNPNGVAVIIGNKSYRHDLVPEVSYVRRHAAAFKRYVLDVLGYDPLNLIEIEDASQAHPEADLATTERPALGVSLQGRHRRPLRCHRVSCRLLARPVK